jgi:hypothetical protein
LNKNSFGRRIVLSEASELAKGAVKSAAEVSTPNIIRQLYKNYKSQPNNLRDLPGKAAMFLLPLMGEWGTGGAGAGTETGVQSYKAIADEQEARSAGQGVSQTVGARPPVEDTRPQWQKLGIKTSPGFQMPPVREPVPIDAAGQMRQRLGLEPSQAPSPAASGQPQFPPPSKIYRTQGEITADTMEDHSIQDMMRDRFARDESPKE